MTVRISVRISEIQEILSPPSVPKLVECRVEVLQTPAEVGLCHSELLISMFLRQAIRQILDPPSIQKVGWGERLIQILGRDISQWSAIDDSLNFRQNSAQLVIIEVRLSNHLAQTPFSRFHYMLKDTAPPCMFKVHWIWLQAKYTSEYHEFS